MAKDSGTSRPINGTYTGGKKALKAGKGPNKPKMMGKGGHKKSSCCGK